MIAHSDYILELMYLISLVVFAEIQFYFIKTNQTFSHFKWGIASAVIAGLLFVFKWHTVGVWDFKLPVAFLLERFVFFSPILNKIRHLSFFYINPDDPHGSKVDKWLGKNYKPVYFICSGLFITIQFFLHWQTINIYLI
jgi:hypothetical protein